VYRAHGEAIFRNFSPIGEYSSTVKKSAKKSIGPPSVGVKELNMIYM
jgi:hypothetical protein